MATKIRLQRGGHKGYAVYRIVAADARAPRDGRFIEKLGMYNPNTNPATIELNFDRALYWLEVGAQPTDTARSILSREGVLLMKHLRGGIKKGAFDEAAAQAKFDAWKADKEKSLTAVREGELKARKEASARNLEEEKKANEAVAKRVAEKKAAAAPAEEVAEEAEVAPEAEAPAAEAPAAEEPVAAEAAAEEAPVAETPAEETPAAEAPAEEAPATEAPAEEAPAEEKPAE